MGLDINGWMEVQINGKWIGKTNLKDLDRNYSAFGILFGVRTFNILPIGHNGKPDEISKEMKVELEDYPKDLKFFIYWVLWSEISTLEITDGAVDYPIYMTELYRKTEKGLVFKGKKDIPSLIDYKEHVKLMKDGELETKNYIYKAVPEIEKFYFDEGWLELFEQAKEYEKEYGASNIRFTAYFE